MPYAMRKIRGKDLYKVWNTETKEIKSSGSTKADAKAQLRLLRGLEKKEAGSLKADQIKDVIDLSYNNKKDKAPDGYVIDKDLSDGRVKVYKDLNSKQVIVAHRGSSGWKDWLDNAYYATTGNIKSSGTYKTHKKKHEKALEKYGADNVIAVGHSRAGKYVEELNRETPVKEVLTYNKAVGLHDAFQKNPKNQTDIRSSRDAISFLAPFQRSSNKVVNIASNTLNPLKAHSTSALSSLGNKLIGKGFKQMRVGDMRKFVKAFKKAKYGEKWTGGSRFGKKELTEMIKPMLEDDDIDEMVGGSIWTDFVKEFSAKHGLKYACALSKYKEPLKKSYKLFKEKKDWFEPFKIDAISEAKIEPVPKAKEPEPNISMTITEPEPSKKPEPKADEKVGMFATSFLEELDNETTFPILVYQTKSLSGLTDVVEKLIKSGSKIVTGYLFSGANNISKFLNSLFTYWTKKIGVMEGMKKIDNGIRSFVEYLGGGDLLPEETDYNAYLKALNATNKKSLYEALKKSVIGSGILSGGNKWTDFVKDYAKSYNTTYGCALSDLGIKQAYKLFKDGKEWYFPKPTASIETQTDEFVEPEPEKAPANIEPVINRLEEKVKLLERIGAEKGAVSYSGATIITDLIFINMMKKYGGRCIINNIQSDYKIDVGIDLNTNGYSDVKYRMHYEKLGKALAECISRGVSLILIPLSLRFGTSNAGHANMLIYRPFKRLVERYEPHGMAYGNSVLDDKNFNDQLKRLWETDLTEWIGKVRYRPPNEYCPNLRGFQDLESEFEKFKKIKSEGGGFCSMWSFFVAELTFLNPDKSTEEILQEVHSISKSEPKYLKSLIRGYVVEAEKELDSLLKTITSSGFTFKQKQGAEDISMRFHREFGELQGWLLSVVFDSKKFSQAPPAFEPLPDVNLDSADVAKIQELYLNKIKKVTKPELLNIFSIYGRKLKGSGSIKRDDIAFLIVKGLSTGSWASFGANGITDLDVILDEELHKKKGAYANGLARTGYFKNKVSGGKFNLGKSVKKAFKPVSKSFDKAGKALSEGAYQASQGLNKINPMMIALNDKKASKAMADLGGVTNDYLLPAVVSMGKPVYDATAMGASTMLTGNPFLGKAVADSLWDNMVADKGYDPRERQKSEALGKTSGIVGNVLGKASGKMW